MVRIVASVERGGSCAPKRGPIERAATVGFAKLGVFSEQAEADEKVGLAAAHGLLQVKDGLRGCTGEASDAFANEVLHALRDLGLLEELGAIAFGGDQDRKSTRLNSSHLGISYAVFCLKKMKN